MLTLKNIRVERDQQLILSLPELTLNYGQLNLLTGPSGAGKSTFLHTISGQIEPTQGSVHWQQQALFANNEATRSQWRAKQVGFIFQDFHLLPSLSAIDNVLLQHSFSRWRIPASFRTQATALLTEFSILDSDKNITQFSRGEKQRIALARALVGNPEIILADEPTASLDKQSAAFVIEQLKQQAAQGKFVLVVSHDPMLIAQADQRIHIERGEISNESLHAA